VALSRGPDTVLRNALTAHYRDPCTIKMERGAQIARFATRVLGRAGESLTCCVP
jgi:hypothetical protein